MKIYWLGDLHLPEYHYIEDIRVKSSGEVFIIRMMHYNHMTVVI